MPGCVMLAAGAVVSASQEKKKPSITVRASPAAGFSPLRVALVADPFDNVLLLVDLSKGRYRTSDDGTVTGVATTDRDSPGLGDDHGLPPAVAGIAGHDQRRALGEHGPEPGWR